MENSLRRVEYKDPEGRRHIRLLPPGAPDSDAAIGIEYGPPPLSVLGLPGEVELRLHNELFVRGLFTYREVAQRPQEVQAALAAAYRVDALGVVDVYRREADAGSRSKPKNRQDVAKPGVHHPQPRRARKRAGVPDADARAGAQLAAG